MVLAHRLAFQGDDTCRGAPADLLITWLADQLYLRRNQREDKNHSQSLR